MPLFKHNTFNLELWRLDVFLDETISNETKKYLILASDMADENGLVWIECELIDLKDPESRKLF